MPSAAGTEFPSTMIAICKLSEVPAEGGLRLDLPGYQTIAVFRVGERYYVVDDRCTHGDASLSEGYIDGAAIICPFHMGAFDLRTGEATAAPCSMPLRTHAAEVRGDTLYARIVSEG